VKVLIDYGADPTVTNLAGHDPVYEAEVNDRREVVEWVLREGGEGLEEGVGGVEVGDEDMGEEADQEEDGADAGEGVREGMEGLSVKDGMGES
jgi:hypothetical protein